MFIKRYLKKLIDKNDMFIGNSNPLITVIVYEHAKLSYGYPHSLF
jgi:protein-disulfide isomerase